MDQNEHFQKEYTTQSIKTDYIVADVTSTIVYHVGLKTF